MTVGSDKWAAPRAALLDSLRRLGIRDDRVLAAMDRVPREDFLTGPFQARAYDNVALPIGCQQTISQPWVVAQMTEALAVTDRHKVLEVGTGCGYQSVILALLCRRLYTVERHTPLMQEAGGRFKALGLTNITALNGDGSLGWPQQAPFERIMVTAAAEDVPPVLLDQLADGGVMVVPVGPDGGDQHLLRVERHGDAVETQDLGLVRFVPLVEGVPEALGV